LNAPLACRKGWPNGGLRRMLNKLPEESMPARKTKILLDGGDAGETQRIKKLIGFLDGQTTNPSLIAKNPEVKKLVASEHGLSVREQMAEYRNIVEAISPLVGGAGVSIEVFADKNTTAEEMLDQAREMFAWIPNAFIKYPCTQEGLRAAEQSIGSNIRVNMTLCFSQAQAAAVYTATKGARVPVYVSPFVGRLDDIGENGVDLVANIKRMYALGDGHVAVLAASIRNLEQLLYCFSLETDLVTLPAKVLDDWARQGFPMPDGNFKYMVIGKPILYQELVLDQSWQSFDIQHELTRKGIEKFVADYRATLSQTM
jgi:transaldolase